MNSQCLRILQVNTEDQGGGAALVAWNLFQTYREQGHESWLAVGQKRSQVPNVLLIPNQAERSRWTRFWQAAQAQLQPLEGKIWGAGWFSRRAGGIAEPGKSFDSYFGHENFRFAGSRHLLRLTTAPPDVVHFHNLHGGYFDLRVMPALSRRAPVILTLHDAWLMTGHCAHSLDCERWRTGCGRCPDLRIYPAINRDGTAFNWRRKKAIYSQSQLYVATPSRWLMQKMENSMLAPAVRQSRLIPNGVDLSIFHPAGDRLAAGKRAARAARRLPMDAKILLFTAQQARQNIWKDYQTVRTALDLAAERLSGQKLILLVLGDDNPGEEAGDTRVIFVGSQLNPKIIAGYYQAADVYVHAARADTFPNTILEALACGTPVVATAVGGIPEQIEERLTGFLTPPGDAETMANRLAQVLSDDELRLKLGCQAAEAARKKFDLNQQAAAYLAWYRELVQQRA